MHSSSYSGVFMALAPQRASCLLDMHQELLWSIVLLTGVSSLTMLESKHVEPRLYSLLDLIHLKDV